MGIDYISIIIFKLLSKPNPMKIFCLTTLIAVLLILMTNESINGQISMDGYSINPKLGAFNYKAGDDFSGIAGVEINAFKNRIIYALDYYHYEEFVLFANPSEQYNQIDFLIGKYIGDRLFRFQYQGGLGTFWGFKRGAKIGTFFDYKKEDFFTIGIPLKLGFKVIPARFISIGIDFQANINFEKPTSMALISLEFGKLRAK
jgi:hypothetical protein